MTEKLDFSLPEKKSKGRFGGAFAIILLLIVGALAAANLIVALQARDEVPTASTDGLSATQVRELATKLAQRDLYEQAAATWQEYVASAPLTPEERAKAFFQVASAFEKAGRYDDAIENYYRSEAAASLDELRPQINTHVKECFEKLGQFAALRYEMMDRTSLAPTEPAGGKVVAEIGSEKITEAQLDAAIERAIDNQLASMSAFLTPDQLDEQKQNALAQYRDSQARQEFLQSWLAQEILYRQALEEGLGEKPQIERMLEDVTRGLLSQELMNQQIASRVNITDTDLQTYYAANKDKYVEPAKAKISHIRVASEAQAAALLERVAGAEDFAALAAEASEDQATKENGGRIDADVVEGSYVSGIGDAAKLNAAIFAAEPGAVLAEPFETAQGWEIVKVQQKTPARQKSYDEVSQQVMTELLQRKREEVQRQYIKEMMDKHNVIVHTSVFAPTSQEPTPQP